MSPYSIGFVVKAAVLMASGLYFFILYHRKGPPFWIGVILFTTGFFDLRFQLELWLAAHPVPERVHQLVQNGIHLLFAAANTLYHYFVLLFYLDSGGLMKRHLYALLLVPVAGSFVLGVAFFPDRHFFYLFTAVWGAGYWLASLALVVRSVVREQFRDRIIYHLALALILLSNGLILVAAHVRGMEFIEFVNLTWFNIFLGVCLLILLWVNMKKLLIGLQREAVVRKIDMGTALLHHSFKNAVGKVKINAWNIRNRLSKEKGLSPQGSAEIEAYVQNLFSTYEHMMGMMARISQIVGNRMVVKPERINLAELLDEAAESVSHLPGVRVVKRYGQLMANLDRSHVLECLMNLIHNAVDAMHGEGTLTISAENKGRRIEVSLTDTGMGMSKEQLSQAFEPFYSTKGKTGKNMGLGLYYVRKVMEGHKGKVSLQSEAGKGTTVTLQFRKEREWPWKK
jgi:signal transduction histidine kinase